MQSSNERVVAQHFDEYAASHRWQDYYEKKFNKDNVAFLIRLDAYVDLLRELAPSSVLDLGCGSGDYLMALPSDRIRYHGVDISPEMIRSLQEKIDRLPAARRAQASCQVAALSELDTKTQYDFVLASGLIEYFEGLEPVVQKMADLAAPGGYVATQVPNRLYYKFKGMRHWQSAGKSFRHHRLTREECDALHLKAGLEKVRGFYIDHIYFPKSRKLFPRLHYSLGRKFDTVTPEFFSRKFATGYIGLYRKPGGSRG